MSRGPLIFDPRLLDARRRRALAGGAPADFLYRAAAEDLIDRLRTIKRRFPLAVDVVSPLPLMTDLLLAAGKADRALRLDRLIEAGPNVVGDAELLPFKPQSLDLVVSLLGLQWANDLPGALAQIHRALRPDGLLIAAIVGGDSLTELRVAFAAAEGEIAGGASPRVAPFVEARSAGTLLQRAGYALPVVDQDRHTVRYASALHLMRDLRAMGATNALIERDRRPLRRRILLRAAEVYAERFADPDGRVRATFEIVWLSGWAPHESQQRPLRPGSAQTRLADALRTSEHAAGERAKP